ncbi:MAG: DUF3037 domain-containing protein [Candidatus Kapaibacterium sp.]|nr:MAG: DUF3037 domain-containing protein [Candidatus Kapabacteria bacterium]
MKTPYSYALVRYKHDVVSGESMNIGIIVFAPTAHFFQARITMKYGRLSKAFTHFDPTQYKSVVTKLRQEFERIGKSFKEPTTGQLLLESGQRGLQEIIHAVLPPNDSSFQIDIVGGGLTENLEAVTTSLFDRFVVQNLAHTDRENKRDEDVWKAFEEVFREQNILQHLFPQKIETPEIDIEFAHCWKNGSYRAYQPLSLDLQEAHSIEDKVFKWYGKLAALAEAKEDIHVSFLVGLPEEETLREKAIRNIGFMKKSSLQPEIIYEEGRYSLAEQVAAEMREHQVFGAQ